MYVLLSVCAGSDGVWSTLVSWKVSLPMTGGWNCVIFNAPSNPNHSMILVDKNYSIATAAAKKFLTHPSLVAFR